jgi:hypothetical protein
MVMESEHMVDIDGVDGDGGEDGVEIPLSGVESRTNLTCITHIVVVVALCFAKSSLLLARSVFRVYKEVRERRRQGDVRGQNDPIWRGLGWEPHHLSYFPAF